MGEFDDAMKSCAEKQQMSISCHLSYSLRSKKQEQGDGQDTLQIQIHKPQEPHYRDDQ